MQDAYGRAEQSSRWLRTYHLVLDDWRSTERAETNGCGMLQSLIDQRVPTTEEKTPGLSRRLYWHHQKLPWLQEANWTGAMMTSWTTTQTPTNATKTNTMQLWSRSLHATFLIDSCIIVNNVHLRGWTWHDARTRVWAVAINGIGDVWDHGNKVSTMRPSLLEEVSGSTPIWQSWLLTL